jgi:hypothetical protein
VGSLWPTLGFLGPSSRFNGKLDAPKSKSHREDSQHVVGGHIDLDAHLLDKH